VKEQILINILEVFTLILQKAEEEEEQTNEKEDNDNCIKRMELRET